MAPVSAVLVALEAKASTTAHVKSLPRQRAGHQSDPARDLYDALNSSRLAIYGASSQALTIAYVQVNNAVDLISLLLNSERISEGLPAKISKHKQPADTQRVLDKVAQIPRRTGKSDNGFDAIGISVFDLQNEGSPVTPVSGPPAPASGSNSTTPG